MKSDRYMSRGCVKNKVSGCAKTVLEEWVAIQEYVNNDQGCVRCQVC